MTSDLFSMFNGRHIDPNYRSSSTSRARMKTWDQRHESQPCWEEELDVVEDIPVNPWDRLDHILNPAPTLGEVWELCALESEDEREDRYGHQADDIGECWDAHHYDEHYHDYDDYDYDYDFDYHYHDSDHPSDVFYCHEEDAADERRHEAVAVWQTTCDEIARFDESCEPLQPEPRPLISDHHSRKAA